MNREQMLEFIKSFAPQLAEGITDLSKVTEADLNAKMVEAITALGAKVAAEPLAEDGAQEAVKAHIAAALESMKMGKTPEAMDHLKKAMEAISGAKPPAPAAPAAPTEAQVAAQAAAAAAVTEATKKADEAKRQAEAAAAAVAAGTASVKDLTESVKALQGEAKAARVRESQANIRAALSESGLPMAMRESLASEWAGKEVAAEVITKRIGESKDLLAKLSDEGSIRGMGVPSGEVRGGITESERVQKAVDLMVDPELARLKETRDAYKGVRPFTGLREAWRHITGCDNVSFDKRRMTPRMVESTLSDFPKVFGDSITRHLLRVYKTYPDYWRRAASIKPLNDFRTQRAIQWGSFTDLAVVAENAAFAALTKPTEREATYAPQKRGGTFFVTREMILADDLRKLRDVGPGMARAAIRTLNKFVFNTLVGNVGGGGINTDLLSYQAAAIYTAGHLNLGILDLDADSLRAARIRLMLQKDDDAIETLGLGLNFKPILWVPIEKKPVADVLVKSEQKPGSANNDINDNMDSVEPVAVPYLGDADNWYLQADQRDLESIELGFVEGEEDPVVLIQDDPKVDSVFSNERFTYKVRHEYGAAVVNHRGLDGSIIP